jgi:MFS family permease
MSKLSVPGLKDNWKQFSLLVLINAFVGGMVGMERTILPEIAETDFGVAARSAIFSFIVVFGITKAVSNYFAGRFAQQFGRKKMLVVGWLFGLPVPFMLMYAPDWNWIIAANFFLGINQGLAWSANVIMKIDLAGKKDRGSGNGAERVCRICGGCHCSIFDRLDCSRIWLKALSVLPGNWPCSAWPVDVDLSGS